MPSAAEPQALPNGGAIHLKADKGAATAQAEVDIIDIGGAAVEMDLKEQLLSMFHPEKGARKLPTLLLYDQRGLQLFEDVRALSSSQPHVASSPADGVVW